VVVVNDTACGFVLVVVTIAILVVLARSGVLVQAIFGPGFMAR
jgi:hypothetical protein